MKIAIHERKGSFSDRWIPYCEEHHIEYKIVDAYANNIIEQVEGCDAFMWHFHQGDYRDMQMAKALILSLETKGLRCFPNRESCWHFDNKVWEKYLLEAVGAPLVPSYVFYTETEANAWVDSVHFPKVFKLKGGAGASNVKLAHTREEARNLIKQCFGKGFTQYRWKEHLREEWHRFKEGRVPFRNVVRPFYYAMKRYPNAFSHYHQKEIGYAYFQDFIPYNSFDTRVVVIAGEYAMAERRKVREGDFRASGSGLFEYGNVDERVLSIAFSVSKRLKMQSVAFDFIMDGETPLIVEISYGFGTHGIEHCGGFWTQDLVWHPSNEFDFYGWMVEDLIKQ